MKDFFWELPQFKLSMERLWQNSSGPIFSKPEGGALERIHQNLKTKFQSKKIGFYDWVKSPEPVGFDEMESLAKNLRQQFDGALCFGIGGSYLGPNAVMEALREPQEKNDFPIRWVNNIDPNLIQEMAYFSQQNRCAAVVISKSGTTVETLSAFYHLSHHLDPKGYVLITDPEVGELRRLAKVNQWHSFEVPPSIGGRFSVLSAVGLFPLLLGGLNAREFFEGARQMRSWLEQCQPSENPAYLFASVTHLWDTQRAHPLHYLMPYGSSIKLIADWFVQLWAESLGKKVLGRPHQSVGPTPVAAVGTSDQHSVLQLLKEGPSNKIVGFIEVDPKDSSLKIGAPAFETDASFNFLFPHSFAEVTAKASLATEASLNNSYVPTYRIQLSQLSERTLGALFFFFETACAAAGELYQVDAFDQPGVEEAKKLLRKSLTI